MFAMQVQQASVLVLMQQPSHELALPDGEAVS